MTIGLVVHARAAGGDGAQHVGPAEADVVQGAIVEMLWTSHPKWVGALIYLIARPKMTDQDREDIQRIRDALRTRGVP